MLTWRKIQYPMIERTKKQNVPDPAARPSTPSVMLTALDAPTMTSTAKTIQPTFPMLIPMADGAGEREGGRGVGPFHGQDGEGQGAQQLRDRLSPLVQPEAAPVVDLDVIVEKPDEAEGHDRADGEIPRTRETDLRADVPDGVSRHDRAHDRDAAHRGRARLRHVGRGPVLTDVLPHLT